MSQEEPLCLDCQSWAGGPARHTPLVLAAISLLSRGRRRQERPDDLPQRGSRHATALLSAVLAGRACGVIAILCAALTFNGGSARRRWRLMNCCTACKQCAGLYFAYKGRIDESPAGLDEHG